MPEPITTDVSDTGTDTSDTTNQDTSQETVTPEEVAKVLHNSGIDIPPPVKPTDKDTNAQDTNSPAGQKDPAVEEPETDQTTAAAKEPVVKPVKEAAKAEPKDTTTPDFSFQVKDANDVTYKIEPGDSIEDILQDFEPKNNGQIIAILDQLREAKDSKAKHEADEATKAKDADKAEQIKQIQDSWNEEIQQLQADKRLPAAAEDKDNKRVDTVYKYMAEINQSRMTSGKPTINSFEDALDKLERQEAQAAKETAAKEDKDAARKNGALVGGSSIPAGAAAPVYKAGSARNINQAIKAMGLL